LGERDPRIDLGGIYSGSPSSSSSTTSSNIDPVPRANSFNPSLILPKLSPSSHCRGPGVSGRGSPPGMEVEVEVEAEPDRLDRRGLEADGRGVA
jgi:hypothetical protein